jgi:hypothetical protein
MGNVHFVFIIELRERYRRLELAASGRSGSCNFSSIANNLA